MRNRTLVAALLATLGVFACGAPASNEFFAPTGASGKTAAGGASGSAGSKSTGGSAGAGGSKSTGGSAGSSGTAGTTGSGGDTGTGGTGGSSGTAGDGVGGTGDTGAGGTAGSGGTGGDAVGGTGTGGTVGGSAGAGGSAGSTMQPDCAALQKAYDAALAAAQVCNADSGKDQCTHTVKGSLTCGCNVFVNPDNETAIKELEKLTMDAASHCAVACPAIACVVPDSATCLPGDGGSKTGQCGTAVATPL